MLVVTQRQNGVPVCVVLINHRAFSIFLQFLVLRRFRFVSLGRKQIRFSRAKDPPQQSSWSWPSWPVELSAVVAAVVPLPAAVGDTFIINSPATFPLKVSAASFVWFRFEKEQQQQQ